MEHESVNRKQFFFKTYSTLPIIFATKPFEFVCVDVSFLLQVVIQFPYRQINLAAATKDSVSKHFSSHKPFKTRTLENFCGALNKL